uniref:Secreted protein n=1 Tax=Aegilops tauschii subsp. strangulata TaxID=200361 RepID=A0A452XF30_AEGTS
MLVDFLYAVLCQLLKCLFFLSSAVPAAHLPPEAPSQLAASWRLHSGHQLLCGLDMCLYQRQGHFGGWDSYNRGCLEPHCLHLLGCKEGQGL